MYNKQSIDLFLKEFPLFIKLVLPFQRKVFISYLLYDVILGIYIYENYAEKLFNIFLKTKSELTSYYDFYVIQCLFYISGKFSIQKIWHFIHHKSKWYANYCFLINKYLKSKNKRYISFMNKIFIEEVEKIIKKVKEIK